MGLRLIVSAILLLLVVVGTNMVLLFSSLIGPYIDAAISPYHAVGAGTASVFEDRLNSKKGLGTISEFSILLDDTLNRVHSLALRDHSSVRARLEKRSARDGSVSLVLTHGAVLHTTAAEFGEGAEPVKVVDNFWETWTPNLDPDAIPLTRNWSGDMDFSLVPSFKLGSMYYTGVPVRNPAGDPLAVVVVGVPEEFVAPNTKVFLDHNWVTLKIVLVTGVVSLILIVSRLMRKRRQGRGNLKTDFVVFVTVIVAAVQIVLTGFVISAFKADYTELHREKTDIVLSDVGGRVAHTLHDPLQTGIVLRRTVDSLPGFRTLLVYRGIDRPVASAVSTQSPARASIGNWIQGRINPLWPETSEIVVEQVRVSGADIGRVVADVSNGFVRERVIETAFDGLMSLIISVLILAELLLLILKYLCRYTARLVKMDARFHYGVMRPAMFLFLFGLDTSISFLPLHMENLYEPMFGLSKDVILGLPISVEFFFVGIAILICGVWLDRRGWYEPFLVGLMIAAMGGMYSWLAPTALHFVVARGVVGFGYGLALMAAQGFVVRYSDTQSKAQGLAQIFAGLYAGHICGAAGGAMLAEWVGFGPVFLVGAVVLLLAVAYTILLMHEAFVLPAQKARSATAEPSFSVMKFLLDRRILTLILFSSLPASIAVIGFVNYFSPIYLSRLGVSQSSIGHIIIIYGLCLVIAGPKIGKLVDEAKDKRPHIALGCVIGACAFLVFPVMDGIWAAISVLLLLGLSSSLVLAAQSAYALQLKITKEFGDGKALGVFRASSRIGQVIGPLVFASAITISDVHQFVVNLGLAYAVSAALFAFLIFKKEERTGLMRLSR